METAGRGEIVIEANLQERKRRGKGVGKPPTKTFQGMGTRGKKR